MKRAHVFYSGRVQGIGFRYTAQNIAEDLGIHGWVKNLEDGRVEIVAESEEKNLKEFLDKISKGPLGRYIKDADVDGVLTDSRIIYDNFGDEIKCFSVYDGFGMTLLYRAGIKSVIITAKKTRIVERRAKDMHVAHASLIAT